MLYGEKNNRKESGATMESCLEQLKNLLNEEDRFCRYNGIRVESIRPGSAEAVMEVRDESLNGLGAVQGGAIFTLADLALAAAANSRGNKAVTQNSTISYLRPGSGRELRAVATEVSRGRRTGLYEVEVRGESGKLVAKIMSGVFISEERFDFFPAEGKQA